MKKLLHSWKLIVGSIFVLALIGAASYLLGWSSLLSVKSVSLSVTGIKDPNFNSNDFINQYLDQHHEVVKLGSPVARLKVNEITHQIEQLPWVHDSFISRGWFSGKVTIYVHEREPVASMSVSAPNTYIDKGGVVFNSPKSYGTLPSILFPGSNPTTTPSNTAAHGVNLTSELSVVAARFVMLMPNELINSTLSIAIYRSDDIELQTNLRSPDLLIKWGGVDQFANKITVLQRLLALKENKKITVIDLTDPSTPLVR